MVQQGQVFQLTRCGPDGEPLWAYRYRTGGLIQRGGFASEHDARESLQRELERLRREARIARRLTLDELVETYLAQHDVQPVTIEKLRYLLSKATAVFGERRIGELTSQEIGEWRMTLSPGEGRRRQPDAMPEGAASVRVVGELEALTSAIGPRYGPMILFAAATGLRPAEWIALETRDVDRDQRVVYVRRTFTKRELKHPKTEASVRAVPLQARALDALDRIEDGNGSPLLFPGEPGDYLDIHHFRPFQWRPAQEAVGISPLRRVYDLRHTFATFALRAGISTFDLSRYMGASLTMIDRHYGHLARDGREHAIKLLDALNAPGSAPLTLWTLRGRRNVRSASARTTERPK
jgi:integrase